MVFLILRENEKRLCAMFLIEIFNINIEYTDLTEGLTKHTLRLVRVFLRRIYKWKLFVETGRKATI